MDRLLQFKSSTLPLSPPPDPTIITGQFHPVYTCGRREIGTISPEQQTYLRADGRADFVEARRGGQTTFHGPGQLVAYPILDLRRHGISPRAYVRLLESCVIATLARWGIKGFTTDNPGVWTNADRKIAALGVHLRRNVSSHGVGLNISTDLWWFNRIVACGLEGKETTSFEREGLRAVAFEEVQTAFAQELATLLSVDEVYDVRTADVASE